MAWSDLELSVDTLKGLAPVDWPSGRSQGDVPAEMTAQARALLGDLLISGLSPSLQWAGGATALLDAIEAEAGFDESVQRLLGYTFLYFWYLDKANRPGGGRGDALKAAEYYDPKNLRPSGLLPAGVKALAADVPVSLGYTARPVGSGASASLASSMSRYTPTTWRSNT